MKKYQVIYADPPWRYSFSKSDSRQIENQYKTMSLDDIKSLNVPSEKTLYYIYGLPHPNC